MEMPAVDHCFGMFPPKYACFLISLAGLATGGIGIAGIVLYGLLEKAIIAKVSPGTDKLSGDLKKVFLGSVGLMSLFLIGSNLMLFFGTTTGSRGLVKGAKLTLLVMCFLLIMVMIGLPTSCYVIEGKCLIKQVSTAGTVVCYLAMGAFVWIWLYFMVVAYNLELEL